MRHPCTSIIEINHEKGADFIKFFFENHAPFLLFGSIIDMNNDKKAEK